MNIGEVLIENIPQLWMGMVGILLNSIVVGTLFGKRKHDWFFLVICSVRFIIYNIGFLAIGNAMYGNETWYKITMSTFATVTALGVGDCNGSFMAGIIGQDFDGYFGSRMC